MVSYRLLNPEASWFTIQVNATELQLFCLSDDDTSGKNLGFEVSSGGGAPEGWIFKLVMVPKVFMYTPK